MRKVYCIFLAFIFVFSCLSPIIAFANENASNSEDFIPSPTIENLYAISGPADIFDNSKFDYLAMLKGSFSENIVECVPLTFWTLNEENRSERFNMSHPNADLWAYDCFIVDADGNIVGNVTCKYLECPYCEWWYDISVTMAPGKYVSTQVVYLVWVA